MTRRVWSGLAMAIALGAITAGGVVISQGGGGAPEGTANVWVDTNGGTCTRSSTAVAYVDAAACGTLDAAWDAMNAGDTARIAAGTYGSQANISGDKASETFFISDDAAYFPNLHVFAANGTFENFTLRPPDSHGGGEFSGVTGNNVTFRDLAVEPTGAGLHTGLSVNADGFTLDGYAYGIPGQTVGTRNCSDGSYPLYFLGGTDDAFVSNAWFAPSELDCPSGDLHFETIRMESSWNNFVVRDSVFEGGDGCGSGYIFHGGNSPHSNTWYVNNVFMACSGGSYAIQGSPDGSCAYNFYYNTFHMTPMPCAIGDDVWVGNLGVPGVCNPTNERNVWQRPTTWTCETDTWVDGPVGVSNLGINADGIHLNAGSPAIDAGETPGASDICTGAIVNSLDREGDTRPAGSVCDAGADERP